jgi:hypothetical protein
MLGKRASPVRREAVRKGPPWYLAGGAPYITLRSVGARGGDSPGPPGGISRALSVGHQKFGSYA